MRPSRQDRLPFSPSLRSFCCDSCDLVFSENNVRGNFASDRAFDLHYQPYSTAQ
jgi:hypothetical protein